MQTNWQSLDFRDFRFSDVIQRLKVDSVWQNMIWIPIKQCTFHSFCFFQHSVSIFYCSSEQSADTTDHVVITPLPFCSTTLQLLKSQLGKVVWNSASLTLSKTPAAYTILTSNSDRKFFSPKRFTCALSLTQWGTRVVCTPTVANTNVVTPCVHTALH